MIKTEVRYSLLKFENIIIFQVHSFEMLENVKS
jgi:hypothetical protein